MTALLQVLKNMGLTDKEPEIYLALLKTTGTQPASIIAQKTNLNRSTVYKTLLKLSKMGLVTKTMKFGITCFFAEEPDKALENLILKRKSQVDGLHQQLIAFLPQIKNLCRQDFYTPTVRFYEGLEGVKRVYEDTLVQGETIYAFINVHVMPPELVDYLENDYLKRRMEKEIEAKVITSNKPGNVAFRKADIRSLRETRFLPETAFSLEIEMNMYGNKTAFFSYKADEMFAVILESEAISNSMKAIFDLCWKFAN